MKSIVIRQQSLFLGVLMAGAIVEDDVNIQVNRMNRWVEVQSHHIPEFLDEKRICRKDEMFLSMLFGIEALIDAKSDQEDIGRRAD